jgi:hypothetical protein
VAFGFGASSHARSAIGLQDALVAEQILRDLFRN